MSKIEKRRLEGDRVRDMPRKSIRRRVRVQPSGQVRPAPSFGSLLNQVNVRVATNASKTGGTRSGGYVLTMMSPRQKILLYSGLALAGAWLVAWAAVSWSRTTKVTAERVRAYVETTDLRQLRGEARAKAIRRLERMLNALSLEERRKLRAGREGLLWFQDMTEEEKARFIEATMPTGFKQMLQAFEQLPEDKRRRAVDDAVRRMREARQQLVNAPPSARPPPWPATNAPPELSEELRQKIIRVGLKSFYSESSAQTRAELGPFLEELQRLMESGRLFMERHRGG